MQIEEIEEVFSGVPYGVIDESLPPQGSLGFRVQLYGIVNWQQLFTSRQLLAAGVFLRHTRQAIARIREIDSENAEALAVYLTAVFGRFIDYCSTQCSWEPSDGEVKHTIAGYKLPMVWDFAEANPLSERDRVLRRRYPRRFRCGHCLHASLFQIAGCAHGAVCEQPGD